MKPTAEMLQAALPVVAKALEGHDEELVGVVAEFVVELAAKYIESYNEFRERLVEEDPDTDETMAREVYERVKKVADAMPEKAPEKENQEPEAAVVEEPAVQPTATLPPVCFSIAEASEEADEWIQNHLSLAPAPAHAADPFPPSTWCPHWTIQRTPDLDSLPSFIKTAPKPPSARAGHTPAYRSMLRAGRTASDLLRKEMSRKSKPAEAATPADAPGTGGVYYKTEARERLPIEDLKAEFLSLIKAQRVLVIEGETGCGKTTKIPQYLIGDGYRSVVVAQPRRVAAVEAAKFVAREMGGGLGGVVGYSVRFGDCVDRRRTRVKYVTDGVLLREILSRPTLDNYHVVMIDEAHERTTNTDLLFALLKKLITSPSRPDLRIIIASATLNRLKFCTYFNHAPLLTIPGRTHPIQTFHSQELISSYPLEAVDTAIQICKEAKDSHGDVLVFLTGVDEIEWAVEKFAEMYKDVEHELRGLPAKPLPLYAAMSFDQQKASLEGGRGIRKIVFSTNIAEASVTLPGVVFVVDTGYAKQRVYDCEAGAETLSVVPISKQSADQRAGRAGRTQPGIVYRLYTEATYNGLLQASLPEIQRTDLSSMVLTLAAMGVDVNGLDFMDPPDEKVLASALLRCYSLGMLDTSGRITLHGRDAVGFPLEPHMAKILLAGNDEGHAEAVTTVLAMATTQHQPFVRPKGMQEAADEAKRRFDDKTGDHVTMLRVYEAWTEAGKSVEWCRANFVSGRCMRTCDDAKGQLLRLLLPFRKPQKQTKPTPEELLRLLCTGLYDKVASLTSDTAMPTYTTLANASIVHIHPSSALFAATGYSSSAPQHILYQDVYHTTKEWVRTVSRVSPKWLLEAVPHYYQRTDAEGIALEIHRNKRTRTE